MSMYDFERCTPTEFQAIYEQWDKNREMGERAEWERVRMSCMCSLQPYTSKRIKATDIMVFPWEKTKDSTNQTEETVDQIRARFKKEAQRRGLK